VGFGISGVEPLSSAARELVSSKIKFLYSKCKNRQLNRKLFEHIWMNGQKQAPRACCCAHTRTTRWDKWANWYCHTAHVIKVSYTLVSSACWTDSFSLWQLTRRTRSLYWALYSTVSWRESPSLCWKSWLQHNIAKFQYDLILFQLSHT